MELVFGLLINIFEILYEKNLYNTPLVSIYMELCKNIK